MSQLVAVSGLRTIAAGIERQQVMDVVRAATFIGTLLLGWVTLHPFESLGDLQIGDVGAGNELMTYATFGALSLLTLALALRSDARGLATLLSPAFVLFGAWLLITVVLSFDPATSVKRLSLTICVIAVTASMMLLPKSQHELMHWFAISALALLAICYLGILLAPDLSIHLASDPQEPGLAGNWRGAFGHKNMAAAVMVMVLFLGVYVVSSGLWISGGAIVALASLFLLYSAGKSSLTLCFAVLLLTSITGFVRSFWLRAIILLTPLLLLNLLSIGAVMFEGLAGISKLLPFDSTFTGRTDIWAFALQSLHARLLTGYGFASFWGSSAIQHLPEGKEWAGFAAHSHNGYLDTALGMGVPGLLLLILVLVILPLKNFQRATEGGNNGPLAMALLRIWLFGLYLSAMESFFLDRSDPIWFTFLLAVFGLHYLARFRAAN
ncbi:O-antigen ligase family protein [Bradyrhizobium sp. BWA-3-5]|uniref:O-antigen ligase family protein n=1 Tax=Bradyrhizobium sp. BWA-3-5 TaxID=3080013 RepID=UPI00293EF69D|nr:O-antigen ligase family protein [Bradyrhizobium sp. BWA-3-5]WOH67282.1 O-antigen ligase family protein [Bradyrhizobium sp. BWA-3-5]